MFHPNKIEIFLNNYSLKKNINLIYVKDGFFLMKRGNLTVCRDHRRNAGSLVSCIGDSMMVILGVACLVWVFGDWGPEKQASARRPIFWLRACNTFFPI